MKATLADLKSKLEILEKTLGNESTTNNKLSTDNNSSGESQNFEHRIKEIVSIKSDDIVKINVGGKHFATKLEINHLNKLIIFIKLFQQGSEFSGFFLISSILFNFKLVFNQSNKMRIIINSARYS